MTVSAPLLAHIQRLVAPSAGELGTDAELLRRFVGSCDQAAFAILVSRHEPMVLRVCRRVLGDVARSDPPGRIHRGDRKRDLDGGVRVCGRRDAEPDSGQMETGFGIGTDGRVLGGGRRGTDASR